VSAAADGDWRGRERTIRLQPIQFFVHRHIRPKYACRQCQTVVAEPLPAQVIDKGAAAPGLLAQVLMSKYQDHQPLYRQETLYQP
jgi:transposase